VVHAARVSHLTDIFLTSVLLPSARASRSWRRSSRWSWAIVPLLVACTERTGKTSDGPYADVVSNVVPRLEKQLGLTFKTPPKLEKKSRADVAKFLMAQLTSAHAKELLAGQQGAYRVLGLLPDTLDLGSLLQRLLEEQVIGYYDPATKVLYVVDGAPKALLDQTIAHELVHALQDQYVKVDSIQGAVDNADRQAAAQAILEGQAVFEQLRLDPSAGPMLKMPGGWDRIRDVIRDGQGGMPVFASAPRAVREGLLFPYLGGADFVRRFIEKRSERELLTDLPISTKQILNDAAYFTADKSQRDTPTDVTLPAPTVGKVTYTNTFGEFEARLILVQHLKDEAVARRGASGIDGDRYALISTPQGDALAWASVWDSAVDAGDFLDLLGDAIRRRYELAPPVVTPNSAVRHYEVAAKGARGARVITIRLEQVGGRPLVYYVDAPATVGDALIDLKRITLGH
jgi:hypothetical protein